jgi:hypothetical protein
VPAPRSRSTPAKSAAREPVPPSSPSEASWQPGHACLDIHGGCGFVDKYNVERKLRKSRVYQVEPINNNMILAFQRQRVPSSAAVPLNGLRRWLHEHPMSPPTSSNSLGPNQHTGARRIRRASDTCRHTRGAAAELDHIYQMDPFVERRYIRGEFGDHLRHVDRPPITAVFRTTA